MMACAIGGFKARRSCGIPMTSARHRIDSIPAELQMMLETSTVKNAPTPAASPRPDPPRYWWLRRLAVVGVLIVVGLAGLRGWWGREAQRRIDAIIAQAQRRGEPILPGDFVTPGNAGSVNPVVTLARTFSWSAPEQAFVNTFNRNAQPTAADRAMIRGIMKAHAAALAQVRAARGLIGTDEVAPPKNVRSEVVHLNAWRNLAEVLGLCAVEAHCVGNDAGALEYIRDLGTVANAVTDENLYLLSYLVAGGITSIESDSAVQLAETLTIAPDGRAGHSVQSAIYSGKCCDRRAELGLWSAVLSLSRDICGLADAAGRRDGLGHPALCRRSRGTVSRNTATTCPRLFAHCSGRSVRGGWPAAAICAAPQSTGDLQRRRQRNRRRCKS